MSLDRGTGTRLSLKNISRKLTGLRNKDYNKVEDLYDTRVPLHNEDAFSHGLRFKAKFIGSLEISRPSCKVDIITAMRRIRYEFKVKGIRKMRITLQVSTQGVRVSKRKRKRSRKRYTEEQLFIMQHPIYRIFYVSHDSQDMKIFSYITRELPDSTFRCNVFKAYKKNMALHIVRSLGQAFDVCHRLNPRPKKIKKEEGGEGENGTEGEEGGGEKEAGTGNEGEKGGGANEAVELGSDLTAALKDESGTQASAQQQQQQQMNNDLMGLDFDPFNFNFEAPVGAAGALPNGGVQLMAFESNFKSGSGTGASPTAFPPLMVSNIPSGLPELPEGNRPAQAQMQLAGRPRPRPATSNQQNIIRENPFTDTLRTGSESPFSIGEGIDGPEKMISNPFLSEPLGGAGQDGQQPLSMWEMQRQQMMAQMALMREQLKQETASRIESQARVEHLLQQNKQLLTHVQKLMVELEKLQSLQMAQLVASGVQLPAAAATAANPTESSSPLGTISPPSLPAIAETVSDTEPTAPTSIAMPTQTPPLTEAPSSSAATETKPLLSSEAEQETTDLFAVALTTTTTGPSTESEQLLMTTFDLPLSTPLLQHDEADTGSPPRTSTPVAPPTSDPQDPVVQQAEKPAFPTPLLEATDLPTNDPFAPQQEQQ